MLATTFFSEALVCLPKTQLQAMQKPTLYVVSSHPVMGRYIHKHERHIASWSLEIEIDQISLIQVTMRVLRSLQIVDF